MQTPLRKLRKAQGKTLSQVAEALNIDPATLSRIERNEHSVSAVVAERICQLFDGEISELEVLYPERFSEAILKE